MTPNDFDRFDAIMQGVSDCFGQTLTAQGIALRFKVLAKHSINDVERAAMSLITSRKYTSMPTVADFLEHLGGGSAEDKAEVEAGKVLEAIRNHGSYSSVVFDDAVTQAAIMQGYGGWVKLCEDCGVEESEKWFRKDFAKIWAAYSRQGIRQMGSLPGRIAITNGSGAFADMIPDPVLIGDPANARAVLEAGESVFALPEGPQNVRGEVCAVGDVLKSITRKVLVREWHEKQVPVWTATMGLF